jgi:hypothetical protein
MKYELETVREIWPVVGKGERIEVGLDRDGLGLLEIRALEADHTISGRVILEPEQALLVAYALQGLASEILSKGKEGGA